MDQELVYLKTNVVPEPLFDGWYAYPHLISPATAAMNIVGRHLKIMDSYISAPSLHAEAIKNPKMLGGPFMDFPTDRTDDVRKLKARTLESQQELIELANAIVELSKLLKQEAKGFSLQPLYCKIPDALRGYVELIYNIHNQPTFRFIEPLLYKSKYFKPESQSIAFYLTDNDDRPFVMSTPRLDMDGVLHLPIRFDDPVIDELFRMQRTARPYGEILERFDPSSDQEKIFRTFFTTKKPALYQKYSGNGIRTRYFGHACILVESNDVSILSDPVISYGYDSKISRLTYTDLPDVIDYVLITHNHQDHILFETLLQLRHKIRHIIVPRNGNGSLPDPNMKLLLQNIGFQNVIEMDELESIDLPNCQITGIPFFGEHADLDIRTKLCYHVRLKELTILFAADMNNIEPAVYDKIHPLTGDIDVLFLGMECDGAPLSWSYGPLLPEKISNAQDQSRRVNGCDFDRAFAVVKRFNFKEVFVYAMGLEPWLRYILALTYAEDSNPIVASNKLLNKCMELGITAERLYGEKAVEYA